MQDLGDFPRLETARLILRPMQAMDAHGYGELLSDETTFPYISDSGPVAASEIPSRISRNNERFVQGRAIYWALEHKGSFIGFVALHEPSERAPALSYAIRKQWRRRGFATEALEAICNYAFSLLACEQLVARAHLDNDASEALLLRAGFVHTGVVSVAAGDRNEFRRAAA
jgi:ribosomal-protein-alanine N-acetyltransferase